MREKQIEVVRNLGHLLEGTVQSLLNSQSMPIGIIQRTFRKSWPTFHWIVSCLLKGAGGQGTISHNLLLYLYPVLLFAKSILELEPT